MIKNNITQHITEYIKNYETYENIDDQVPEFKPTETKQRGGKKAII